MVGRYLGKHSELVAHSVALVIPNATRCIWVGQAVQFAPSYYVARSLILIVNTDGVLGPRRGV